jgi:hypothetical protein
MKRGQNPSTKLRSSSPWGGYPEGPVIAQTGQAQLAQTVIAPSGQSQLVIARPAVLQAVIVEPGEVEQRETRELWSDATRPGMGSSVGY